MKIRVLTALLGALAWTTPAVAQDKVVTGKVSREAGVPLSGVTVIVKGTNTSTQTNQSGDSSIRVSVGQTLQYRLIGYLPQERNVGSGNIINVMLDKAAANLDAMVVTALGQQTVQRSLGVSQQTVAGADIAQTGRENFINGL